MKFCDYQILEYTTSELQTHGVPLAVVVRLHELGSYKLKIFVLREWKLKIGAVSKDEIDEIAIFLRDFVPINRDYALASIVFEKLEGLNVGPIRASVSGYCSCEELDAVLQGYFENARGSSFWPEHFDNLV
jgi:hypothetical protein